MIELFKNSRFLLLRYRQPMYFTLHWLFVVADALVSGIANYFSSKLWHLLIESIDVVGINQLFQWFVSRVLFEFDRYEKKLPRYNFISPRIFGLKKTKKIFHISQFCLHVTLLQGFLPSRAVRHFWFKKCIKSNFLRVRNIDGIDRCSTPI